MRESLWLGAMFTVCLAVCWWTAVPPTPVRAAAASEWGLFARGTPPRSDGRREMVVRAIDSDLASVDAEVVVYDSGV